MYDYTIQGQPLRFGNSSALYESDMVIFDHETGSYWQQVNGRAIVGPLMGERLLLLPAQTTTWALWKDQFPDTQVLSRDTGHVRRYDYDPFLGLAERLNRDGDFLFPVSELARDPRLDPGAIVVGVEVDGRQRAYPIQLIGDGVVNDSIGEVPIVVFSAVEGPTGAAYVALVENATMTFSFVDGRFRDDQTNSTWNLAGVATSGELAGTQLQPLPMRSTLWFSLVTSFPDIELYRER